MKPKVMEVPDSVPPEPRQARGRKRVAAILSAGAEVFLEKGYHGATMTEIAERSNTAIGSLYRFFPKKEHLADALLLQYATNMTASLKGLNSRASQMSHDVVADELVDLFATFQAQRSFAAALIDARGGSAEKRLKFRGAVRNGMEAVVCKVIPGLTPSKVSVMAMVLLHLLKGIYTAGNESPEYSEQFMAELRDLIRAYLETAMGQGARIPSRRVKM